MDSSGSVAAFEAMLAATTKGLLMPHPSTWSPPDIEPSQSFGVRKNRARNRGSGPLGSLIRAACGLILAFILAGAGAAASDAPPAEAATVGRMISIGGWKIGAFLSSSGHYVYCIEPGAVEPSSRQQTARTVSSLPGYSGGTFDPTGWSGTVTSGGLSGDRLRQINYVLWQHGRTTDKWTAAAVQFAIWILRGDPGAERWLTHHVEWARAHGGRATIEHANMLVAEARREAKAAEAPVLAAPIIEQDRAAPRPAALRAESGAQWATGSVRLPAGSDRVRIDGATFVDGTKYLVSDSDEASTVRWQAELYRAGWSGEHRVSVSVEGRLSSPGWPAKVELYPPTVSNQQKLVAGVGPVSADFSPTAGAKLTLDLTFEPEVVTEVPERLLQLGRPFVDAVTIDTGKESGPWPSRRTASGGIEYAPVRAEGTVYGPFESPQPVSAEVPPGVPVAARATLTADRGPGEYRVEADGEVEAAGYYYWVWSIREEAQPPGIQGAPLLPAGYEHADRFGLAIEGHVSPTRLRWKTTLEDRTLEVDDLVLRDAITVTAEDDVWLRDEAGERVSARIRLTAYQSDSRPIASRAVPGDAREAGHGFVTVDEPGDVHEPVLLELPATTTGWVTVRACLLAEDQPSAVRGLVQEWCDDYGMPSETARILPPELTKTGAPVPASAMFVPAGLGLVAAGTGVLALRRRRGGR